MALATAFSLGCAGYLLFYYLNTGNAFYHFIQIKNAAYFNPCSYGCLPTNYLLKRLTITIPLQAVLANAWPLLLIVPMLVTYKKQDNPGSRFWIVAFASLLLLALYFPFSISPYVPLCHDMRQFFFLFPFAAIRYMQCINNTSLNEKKEKKIMIVACIFFAVATLTCFVLAPFLLLYG